jgi:hypothetical protein
MGNVQEAVRSAYSNASAFDGSTTKIARSPCRHFVIVKAMIVVPKPTNKPIDPRGSLGKPSINSRQRSVALQSDTLYPTSHAR